MAADYFRAATTGYYYTLVQSVTVTNPGCIDGDVLAIVLGGGWQGDYTPTSSGWTEIAIADVALLQHKGSRLFMKTASSEPSSWTFTWPEAGAAEGAWISAAYKHGNLVTGAAQGGAFSSPTSTHSAYTNTENNAVALTFGTGRWFSGGVGFTDVSCPSPWTERGVTGYETTYGVDNRVVLFLADEYVASGNFPAGVITFTTIGAFQGATTRLVTAADFDLVVPTDAIGGGSVYTGRRVTARDLPYHINKRLTKDV